MSRFTDIEPPERKHADSRGFVLATEKGLTGYWLVPWRNVRNDPDKHRQWDVLPKVKRWKYSGIKRRK